ncbi:unnamed protein product [Arabis nemorensis]|uniref:Uncharacterized protein n=1 Tax=Arabis nemorensis TaxID=586526 RepID=A0A565BBS6_9BRAS|nr:unnamed protein product [Arabis nemorensis]
MTVETLLNNMELGESFKTDQEVNSIQEGSYASELDITEAFERLSLKEDNPRANQCKHVYLTGNGVQSIKNHTEITSELQDMMKTSQLLKNGQIEQE